MSDQIKAALDWTMLGVIGATILDYRPYAAAILPIVYWVIRISETDTVRKVWRRMWS